MKTHTSQFKSQIKEFGRELDSIITFTLNGVTTELGTEQLNSVTPHYEGAILKSVMKQLDIDSNVEIPIGTELNYQFGIKVRNAVVLDYKDNYDYVNYGNYIVKDVEKQEDTRSWKITCYDKMLYTMKDYENVGITYPTTIKNYLTAICTKTGLTLNANDFANSSQTIDNELYLDEDGRSLGYTFRKVLDEIAQVSGGTICINSSDELEVRYIKDVGELTEITGNNVSVTSEQEAQLQVLKIDGNTTQATRDDKNLFNYRDTTIVTSGVTTDNEGWITVTYDNTSGTANKYFNYWTNNLALNTSTNYRFIIEVKTVTGGGSLIAVSNSGNSGQINGSIGYSFASLTNGVVKAETKTTKASFTSVTDGLRTYIQFQAGQSGSVTFRISVLADTSITPSTFVYQPYGVSPSPYYPSELIGVGYQNILKDTSNEWSEWYVPGYNLNNRSFYLYFTDENMQKFTKNQQFTFSFDVEFDNVTGTSGQTKLWAPQIVINETLDNMYNGQWISFETQSNIYTTIPTGVYHMEHTFTLSTDRTNYVRYGFVPRVNYWASGKFRIKNVQLQVGNLAGDFIEYGKYGICAKITSGINSNRQSYVLNEPLMSLDSLKDQFNIQNGMLNVIRKVGKLIVDEDTTMYYSNSGVTGVKMITIPISNMSSGNYQNGLSSHFINKKTGKEANTIRFGANDTNVYIYIKESDFGSLDAFKTWLESNNVEIQYILSATYTENLGGVTLPSLYAGSNTINIINSNNTTIKTTYVSDFEEIDEEYLKDVNVNFGEKFGKVNTLILSRGGDSDKIALSIPSDLADNEKVAIQITDNQIMNGNNRADFMQQILNRLYGLEYYINDFSSTGICYLDLCDRYKINIDNNIYSCVMLNDSINVTQGLEEQIYTDMQEENDTEYKYVSSDDRGITQANIIAKKNEATIIETTQRLDTANNRLNAVETQQTETDRTINIISTHIDTNGNITEVTTTTGFTFNADGMTISDSNTNFSALHRNDGTYYKDGSTIVGQYTKDGSKQKDLELFGVYYYGMDEITDTPMFVAQLYTDENNEECFGHFYNRGD